LKPPVERTGMKRKTVPVAGMSCDGCEETVETALLRVDGVAHVTADHETGTVEVVAEDDVTDADVDAAIERAGYEVGE